MLVRNGLKLIGVLLAADHAANLPHPPPRRRPLDIDHHIDGLRDRPVRNPLRDLADQVLQARQSLQGAVGVNSRQTARMARIPCLQESERLASAYFADAGYIECEVVDVRTALAQADVLLTVQPPSLDEIAQLKQGTVVIGHLQPHLAPERTKALRDRKITAFAMELLPRTTRAQAMDVLSSQAAVAGYKAVLIAAEAAPKFFPMLTTAAGTIRPSKVLIVGAGVAGLQAIATARRLGAQVEGFDVRPETKEQIESLGAKFLDLGVGAAGSGGYARELTREERDRQQQALADQLKGIDVVVTTAAVPGRKAPRIISAAMVAGMKPGAVIVDIAAETGGNCELSEAGRTVVSANGVSVDATAAEPA